MVGVALGEMRNPRRNVARAVKACFYRIVFLYCGSIFCVGESLGCSLLYETTENRARLGGTCEFSPAPRRQLAID